jgi:hypothetical protein
MTQDEIIEMARQVGFQTGIVNYMSGLGGYPFVQAIGTGEVLPNLEAFARLVAAKEREACAKVCESIYTNGDGAECWLENAASKIRARGEQE